MTQVNGYLGGWRGEAFPASTANREDPNNFTAFPYFSSEARKQLKCCSHLVLYSTLP
jgi:hypothetical protein